MEYELLLKLKLPEDIKTLDLENKAKLCAEARDKIIHTVSTNGGHLASNLGVVELTLAIHSVFDSPKDKILFDVGHQSYVHKLFTGRYEAFDTLRKKGGLSGFSRPDESEHDPAISGHSSNSISLALGMAEAMRLQGDNHHAVAVIGDGALTGGLAYEGLNNAGRSGTNLVVILNYNEMSISENIGGVAKYLSELRTTKSYKKTKNFTKKTLSKLPLVGKPLYKCIHKFKRNLKEEMIHSNLFEDLGFEFIGPIDGHDIKELEKALANAKSMNKPVLVQVITKKGKGYEPAEQHPNEFHGVTSFNIEDGTRAEAFEYRTFAEQFANSVAGFAYHDKRICGITAAMKDATGMQVFEEMHKERFFDVGIAEEHAVSFAAGLASMGMVPVFAVYSSFLQRTYDQLIHDVALPNLHVVLAIGNAGIVGEDGETHQGIFDIPMLMTIPNTTIYAPANYEELDICLDKAIYEDTGLACVRFPKDDLMVRTDEVTTYFIIRGGRNCKKLIVTYGRLAYPITSVSAKYGYDVMKIAQIHPLSDTIKEQILSYDEVIVYEESMVAGGLGEQILKFRPGTVIRGITDFVPHMSMCEAFDLYRFTEEKIEEDLRNNGQTT